MLPCVFDCTVLDILSPEMYLPLVFPKEQFLNLGHDFILDVSFHLGGQERGARRDCSPDHLPHPHEDPTNPYSLPGVSHIWRSCLFNSNV